MVKEKDEPLDLRSAGGNRNFRIRSYLSDINLEGSLYAFMHKK